MKRHLGIVIFITALAMLLATAATAAPNVPLKLEKVAVQAYSALFVEKYAGTYGQQEVLSAPGKVFVSITVLIDPQWTKDTKRVQIRDKEITLEVGGVQLTMVGYMKYPGFLSTFSHSLYASRPYRWPNTVRKETYNAVFLVPQGTTQAVFHLGDTTAPIKVPAQAQGAPNPAASVKVAVLGSRMVPQLKREVRIGSQKLQSTITLPMSQILEVRVGFSALKSNLVDNPSQFMWNTRWFGASYPGGAVSPCLGELRREGVIHDNMTHSRPVSSAQSSPEEITLYFAVPAKAPSFKLLYRNQPVAEGQIGGGASAGPAPKDASSQAGGGSQPKKGGLLRRIMGK